MNARKLAYRVAIALLAVGVVALIARLVGGHRYAAYGSYVTWGLWVAMYLFFAGVAAGAFVFATLDLLFGIETFKGTGRIALWTALVSLSGALLTILLDLGHMGRVWKVFAHPHFHAVMAQMVWGYTIFGIVIAATLRTAIKSPGSSTLRYLLIAGLALSLFVAGGVGAFLGVDASRLAWREAMLPVQFPVLALASGAAAMMAIIGLFGSPDDVRRTIQIRFLAIATTVFVIIKLYFVWADYSQALYGSVPQSVAAVKAVLFGPHWWAFWILQLGLGTLLPVAMLARPSRVSPLTAGWMGVLVLVGFAVARANIVFPALTVPEFDALAHSFSGSPRLTFEYFPSLMEWGVTFGVTGLVVLAFLVGSDRLPAQAEEVVR